MMPVRPIQGMTDIMERPSHLLSALPSLCQCNFNGCKRGSNLKHVFCSRMKVRLSPLGCILLCGCLTECVHIQILLGTHTCGCMQTMLFSPTWAQDRIL